MKSFTTIDNLRTMFKEDFSKGYENQFVKLKEDIIRELQESKRTLEDHKIEAMAIIKEHEHRELMAGVALGILPFCCVMPIKRISDFYEITGLIFGLSAAFIVLAAA